MSTTAEPTPEQAVTTGSGTRRSARRRLLDAANELFYAEGVNSVGIDRVIEKAGVAKASLYSTFGSKEALVRAYLQERHTGTTGRLSAAIEAAGTPREKILAVFATQAELFTEPDFRGCAFVAATSEARRGGLVEQAADEYRAWIRGMFRDLAEQVGASAPDLLAAQLQVIYDGTGLSARMDRRPDIATAARAAVVALLDATEAGHETGRRA
jgi:AcrR family transcriptional regulator